MEAKYTKNWIERLLLNALLLAVFTGGLSGCSLQSRDELYTSGLSYQKMFQAQVINPDAPRDRTPDDGMAGTISQNIYVDLYGKEMTEDKSADDDRHRSSYTNKEEVNITME
jgi:hypothetical protein